MNTKGETFGDLGKLALGVVTLAIVLTVGFMVMSQGQTQMLDAEGLGTNITSNCVNSAGCNATATMIDATGTIPGWIPIVIIVGIGVILLGLVKTLMRK